MSKIDAPIGSMTTAQTTWAESRRDPRDPTRKVVLIYWLDDRGLPCDACAVIRDVSAHGIGIETDRPFDVSQPLTIRTANGSLECVVRRMQEDPSGFLVGLKVLSSSGASSPRSSLANLASLLTQ